jgi:hypothetical protein
LESTGRPRGTAPERALLALLADHPDGLSREAAASALDWKPADVADAVAVLGGHGLVRCVEGVEGPLLVATEEGRRAVESEEGATCTL